MSTSQRGIECGRAGRGWADDEGASRGLARLGALAGLALVEILSLSLRFDTGAIEKGLRQLPGAMSRATSHGPGMGPVGLPRGWISWLVEQSHLALAIGITAVSATLVFGGRGLRESLARSAEASPIRRSWPMLAGHLAVLAAFWRLTTEVFEGGAMTSAWAWAWVAGWALSGLSTALMLIVALFPPPTWGDLARRGFRAAVIGGVVGLVGTGAGLLARAMWRPLGRWTLEAVRDLLAPMATNLVCQPESSTVGTGTFAVRIAPSCSGYEGIGLIWAFLGAYLWLRRRELRWPRAWLLLPIGTAAAWVANVLRITALILVGTGVSSEVALGGFHSQAGWLGFIAVALGLVVLARRVPYFRRGEPAGVEPVAGAEPVAGPAPEAVYLAPLLMIVAAGMIGGAFSAGGLDRYYPARLAAVALPLWLYRREYAAMRWAGSWQAPAIGVLVFALWVARWPEAHGGPWTRSLMATGGGGWTAAWLAARVVGSVVAVPIAEELAFRGFLTRRLIAADFEAVPPGRWAWAPVLLSSIAFGVLHDRWAEGTMAGLLYALAYHRRGSLGDAVAAHATTNALLSADALLTGDWSLFS